MTEPGASILAIFRIAKIRYLAMTVPPFVVGVMEGPHHDVPYLLLGIVAIVLLQGIGSIGNGVSDQTEDAIDHPQRVALSEGVGYSLLRSLTNWLILAFLVLVAIIVLTCDLYFGATILWIAFLLVLWSYSFGPRLKPKRFSATVLLGGLSGGMFFIGWIGGGISEMAWALSGATLLWVMGASLIGSKDAPNLEGDELAGYRSVYRNLIESNHSFLRAIVLLGRPFLAAVVLSILTLSDGPGWKLLWCWTVVPLTVGLAWMMTHAVTPNERSFVRELGYFYWITFMGVVLVSLFPGWVSLCAAAAGLGWYLLASWLLHPDPTPKISHLLQDLRHEIP